ncbi:hypothetical protein V1527DRAFT_493592 [Lipomyces starkeyi]
MPKRPLADSSCDAPHSPSSELERRPLQIFIDLHASDPKHDIWRTRKRLHPIAALPLYGQSWENVCKDISSWVSNEMQIGCRDTANFRSLRSLAAVVYAVQE